MKTNSSEDLRRLSILVQIAQEDFHAAQESLRYAWQHHLRGQYEYLENWMDTCTDEYKNAKSQFKDVAGVDWLEWKKSNK